MTDRQNSKRRADDEILGDLHVEVAKHLLDRIKTGEATPAEINAAIKFLANNHIEATTVPGDTLDSLAKSLPDFDDEEDD